MFAAPSKRITAPAERCGRDDRDRRIVFPGLKQSANLCDGNSDADSGPKVAAHHAPVTAAVDVSRTWLTLSGN